MDSSRPRRNCSVHGCRSSWWIHRNIRTVPAKLADAGITTHHCTSPIIVREHVKRIDSRVFLNFLPLRYYCIPTTAASQAWRRPDPLAPARRDGELDALHPADHSYRVLSRCAWPLTHIDNSLTGRQLSVMCLGAPPQTLAQVFHRHIECRGDVEGEHL